CCQTTIGALIPAGAPVSAPVIAAPQAGPPSISTTPGPTGPPNINEQREPGNVDKLYYPQLQQQQNPAGIPNASWRPSLGAPTFPTTTPTPPPPPVKLDRIVVGPDATVEGQVVRSDNAPRPNAKIIFVSSNQASAQRTVTANSAGRFQINLATGSWNVYLHGSDGNP